MPGLSLVGWFIGYMQRPDWDEGAVGGMVTAYCLLQKLPIILIAWFTTRFNNVHRRLLPEAKRRAILQRRGLFDFVSPTFRAEAYNLLNWVNFNQPSVNLQTPQSFGQISTTPVGAGNQSGARILQGALRFDF